MIEFLFLDLDDTVFDFHKAERVALSKTIQDFGVEPTEEILTLYHKINKWHWQQLELGKITRERLLVERFGVLFQQLGHPVDPESCAQVYEKNLSTGHWYLPGAEQALQSLKKTYKLYLVSNGTARVQHGRMKSANLYQYFEDIFISQEIGVNKPDKRFFDACFARVPGFSPEKSLMVGDSLTSDIQGGINAGIKTVWVNPTHQKADAIVPDYEIEGIWQLEKLLEEL